LGTDWQTFSRNRSFLIIVFRRIYEFGADGKEKQLLRSRKCGHSRWILLAAIHQVGLVSLTHTLMNFLTKTLSRPENEKPFLLIPVGYPAAGLT
jgi:hypothetical protein